MPDLSPDTTAVPQRGADSGLAATIARLRSPQSGLLGQLLRFGFAGGVVTLVYLTITTVLSQVVGLPFEAALAIGFVSALLLHFTLQRLFVWIHHEEFALPIHHQIGRYLLMAGSQYGITVAATTLLPSALGLPVEVVYLMTMAVVTSTGFLVMRFIIFHGEAGASCPDTGSAESDAAASKAPVSQPAALDGTAPERPEANPVSTPAASDPPVSISASR